MFNPPPPDLDDREPLIHLASPADFWYRSYRIGNSPIFFGRSKSHRWDSPDDDFGVLYLGEDEYCTFMESIGRGALKTRFVPNTQLKSSGLAKIRFKRTLRLIDMVTSGGLTRLGAESSLTSGSGYKNSQRWSRALREHPSKPDGIYYRSRHDPARMASALFDHCEGSVEVAETQGLGLTSLRYLERSSITMLWGPIYRRRKTSPITSDTRANGNALASEEE